MRDMYELGGYEENNPTWHEEDAPWKADHISKIIHRNDLVPASIAEVGCGTGQILLELEKRFPDARLSGYEISPHAYGRAAKKETLRTKFYLRDATVDRPPLQDVLLAIDVVEHVEDYISFLKSIKALGEYKIFHIPLDISVQSVFRRSPIINQRESVGHIQYFFKDTALATLTDCGYDILDYFYTPGRLELPNQALTSKIMAWPRRILFSINADFAVRVLGGYSLLVLAK